MLHIVLFTRADQVDLDLEERSHASQPVAHRYGVYSLMSSRSLARHVC